MASKLVTLLRHVMNMYVSSSLHWVFPFSHRRLCYFVLSALHFGEFKCFDGNIYQKLSQFFLFILNVHEHDFKSPLLRDFNHGNSYIPLAAFLIAFVDFHSVKYCLESVEK